MQVFTRQIRVLGAGEAIAWAAEVTAKVREIAELPVSLWAATAGMPTGTMAWSAPIEGMAQMADVNQQLMADASYLEMVASGRDFIAEVLPDRVHQLIHGEITEPAAVGSYMGNVTAVAAEGNGVAAGAWAVKIADIWGSITGLSPVVTTTLAGPMFEYSWFVRHADAASIDDAHAKILASADYAAEVDSAAGLFHPGAAQVYAQRVA